MSDAFLPQLAANARFCSPLSVRTLQLDVWRVALNLLWGGRRINVLNRRQQQEAVAVTFATTELELACNLNGDDDAYPTSWCVSATDTPTKATFCNRVLLVVLNAVHLSTPVSRLCQPPEDAVARR